MKRCERIKDFREKKDLTQEELTKILGCDPSYISQIENKIRKPSLEFLEKLNKAFGISSDYILYGSEEGPKNHIMFMEAEFPYETLSASIKKSLDNAKEILQGENKEMSNLLKDNIDSILRIVRSNQKKNENEGGK